MARSLHSLCLNFVCSLLSWIKKKNSHFLNRTRPLLIADDFWSNILRLQCFQLDINPFVYLSRSILKRIKSLRLIDNGWYLFKSNYPNILLMIPLKQGRTGLTFYTLFNWTGHYISLKEKRGFTFNLNKGVYKMFVVYYI